MDVEIRVVPDRETPGLVLEVPELTSQMERLAHRLGRWMGWYAEVGQIREKLGLVGSPSFLKWQETLPHIVFAGFLCFLLPTILRLCDDVVPVLSMFFAFVLLPIGGFCSAFSLGKRQGFCPLYPLACTLLTLLFILAARLYSNIADGIMVPIAVTSSLLGNLLGAGIRASSHARRKG